MSLSIRTATLDDARAITELTGELGYDADASATHARLARLLGRPDQLILVAERAGHDVVGWLQVATAETVESGFRAEIVGLVVAERARRAGAGRALVACAEHWARECQAPVIGVRSNLQRSESHAFYRALGYAHTKNQAVYRKSL